MCTSFLAFQTGNFGITGRSLDYDQPTQFLTSQSQSGTTFSSVLNNGVSWVSQYGIFTIDSVDGYNVPFEGVNSAGLSISGNLANATYPQNNPGPTISSDDIVNYVLSQASDVWGAADLLTSINVQSQWKYHYIVFDASGNSLVVEFEDEMAVCYFNESFVLTNNPNLNYQLENQNNYANIKNWFSGAVLPDSGDQFHGQGMLGLPGDWMSPSRYTRVTTMLEYSLPYVNGTNDAIYLVKRILDSASLIKGVDLGASATGSPIYTQVQIVKDILNSVVYWREYDSESWTIVNIIW
ncbi:MULTISPECIES: linear amide C-N hydrolase [unclassified Flavobacterium]|uniref:linear amide C-N hydrolase n=1 Tax=unclassified Flavobacterium TaxID=196869 RepID=UPI001F145C77|nr:MULTISPECIES: linear amide C-N hydrolase [unclassified Flavobacterium]UMY64540.1 linear amide C-N hydrolase [Flavobacterium sp. HJ-32-4]